MLKLSGFDVIHRHTRILCPVYIPVVSWFINDVLVRIPVVEKLGFVQGYVARPEPNRWPSAADYSVSVIIPCRDEKGNIESTVLRTPNMGSHTELIFCDDQSTDGTADEVRRMQKEHPERDIRLMKGPGICKAENVWTGFDATRGDILMILDGDLAVPPEELPRFHDALASGRGEFINGSRMVYPIRSLAMRTANIVGNKAFSLLGSSHECMQGE